MTLKMWTLKVTASKWQNWDFYTYLLCSTDVLQFFIKMKI